MTHYEYATCSKYFRTNGLEEYYILAQQYPTLRFTHARRDLSPNRSVDVQLMPMTMMMMMMTMLGRRLRR